MFMKPRIETLPETILCGKRARMSIAENKTRELWQSFMSNRYKIATPLGPKLYSVEVYDSTIYFESFDATKEFEKWAAIKVSETESVPSDMEILTLPKGKYAVFQYKGKPSEAFKMYQYIYGSWIPASEYVLDDRPHFAIMGVKYKDEDPESEEELWIPVIEK